MKWKFLLFMFLVCSCFISAQNKIPVTFSVNMGVQIKEGNFDPAKDKIYIRGNFQKFVGDASDWSGTTFTTLPVNGDSICALTIDFPDSADGKSFEYKFVLNDGGWESFEPPRALKVQKPSMILPTVFFNNDSIVTIYVYNTLNFTADITSIYGTGEGHFDPDKDSLKVEGLDWVGATVTGGVKKFVENPFMPGIYTATVQIKGVLGDSTKWKSKAYPDGKFFNNGWEITTDKWHKIVEDGSTIDLPVFVPDIFPKKPALTNPVEVLFQVDITNSTNKYTKKYVDPSQVISVVLKGQNKVLGEWKGDWKLTDTTLIYLNDSGTEGDKVAGDKIWSKKITFPAGNDGGPSLYKYGIYYPGADTLNDKINPLDNELPSGFDHYVNIKEGAGVIEVLNTFGSLITTTDVKRLTNIVPDKFYLEQNYPNPFNPRTVIRYSITGPQKVNLKVYDLLGRQVAELINMEQNTGSYEVSFDAAGLGSGIYFYKLTAGNNSSVKKMLLVK
ncbi:MAG: T9SS type A sorting domain-containing protein [Bacteroidota bacterium]